MPDPLYRTSLELAAARARRMHGGDGTAFWAGFTLVALVVSALIQLVRILF